MIPEKLLVPSFDLFVPHFVHILGSLVQHFVHRRTEQILQVDIAFDPLDTESLDLVYPEDLGSGQKTKIHSC